MANIHLQVRPLGVSPNGEVWTFGLRYFRAGATDPDPRTATEMQEMVDGIAALYTNRGMPSELYDCLGATLGVAGWRLEQYDVVPDGAAFKPVLIGAAEATYPTPKMGAGVGYRPVQSSMVVTLNYGAQYGRTGRGRVYVPAIGAPTIGSNLRFAQGSGGGQIGPILLGFNDMQASWGSEINGAGVWSPPYVLGVLSRKLGTLREVENLSIGDVPDTQRRRRDRWQETRSLVVRA